VNVEVSRTFDDCTVKPVPAVFDDTCKLPRLVMDDPVSTKMMIEVDVTDVLAMVAVPEESVPEPVEPFEPALSLSLPPTVPSPMSPPCTSSL
jgi:hypothetical protein